MVGGQVGSGARDPECSLSPQLFTLACDPGPIWRGSQVNPSLLPRTDICNQKEWTFECLKPVEYQEKPQEGLYQLLLWPQVLSDRRHQFSSVGFP